MASVISLQHFVIPTGHYSIAISNIGGEWFSDARPLLQALRPRRIAPVINLLYVREEYAIVSGTETKHFAYQLGFRSHDWTALANYNWAFGGQNTAVASSGMIQASVWCPIEAAEMMYWIWTGALVIRTTIEAKQASGAVSWVTRPPTVAGTQESYRRSDAENELAKWIARLEALTGLQPGWNRYEAPTPSDVAIRAAREFLAALIEDEQPPTRVAASAVGGVGVSRQVGERIAYFEFYNDGGACALLADDAANERVLDIASERRTLQPVLDEVRAFLNG